MGGPLTRKEPLEGRDKKEEDWIGYEEWGGVIGREVEDGNIDETPSKWMPIQRQYTKEEERLPIT